MPTFRVTDPNGRVLKITGDTPPTEQELDEIFKQNAPAPTTEPEEKKSSFWGDLGRTIAKPAVEGVKMLELIGAGMTGDLSNPDRLTRQQNLPQFLKGAMYSPEEVDKNFGGKTEGERIKNTMTKSLKTSAGVGSYFVPVGGGKTKAVTTIAKQGLEKFLPGAMTRVLQAAGYGATQAGLAEFSNDDSTVGSVADAAKSGAVTSGALNVAGQGLDKVGNFLKSNVPKSVTRGLIKPPTTALQESETEKAIKYGEKMLGEKLVDRGELKATPKKILESTYKKLDDYGKQIGDIVQQNGDAPIPVQPIKDRISSLKGKYSNVWSPELEGEVTRFNNALDALAGQEGTLKARTVWELRKEGDSILRTFYKSGKEISDISPEQALRVEAANAMREIVAETLPQIKKLNSEYSFYKALEAATMPVINKQIHRQLVGDLMMVGMSGTAGFGIGNIPGALTGVITGILSARALRSPSTWLGLAKTAETAGKGVTRTAGSMQGGALQRGGSYLEQFLRGSQEEGQ